MILCLGTTPAIQRSMTFATVTLDGVNRTADVRQYASGKSLNVARVLHTLGRQPLCLGFAGGDGGRFVRRDLDALGVPHEFVEVPPNTRTCTTVIDRATGTATELIEESSPVPVHVYEAVLATLRAHLPHAEAVVLSGSLPPGAPVDFYAKAAAAAQEVGKFVLLDAAGEPLRRALSARPTVVKPNRHELEQTVNQSTGDDASLKDAIRALLHEGPAWAVVSHGRGETIVSDGSEFWKLNTPTVDAVSAIGSGDSFAAGLAAAVVGGATVPEACRTAVACGAANAMTADAGHLRIADVERLRSQVQVNSF